MSKCKHILEELHQYMFLDNIYHTPRSEISKHKFFIEKKYNERQK